MSNVLDSRLLMKYRLLSKIKYNMAILETTESSFK